MNKEDFVTYEQAVKLKELGFNWDCQKSYLKMGCSNKSKYKVASLYYNYNKSKGTISAPTLAQAAKWLREKHNLYIDVYLNHPTVNDSIWAYSLTEINRNKLGCNESLGYNTYEEALSAGIDKALKLIEK